MPYSFRPRRTHLGRIPQGVDLLKGISQVLFELDVTSGSVNIIGAVRKAMFGYYDQEEQKYVTLSHDEEAEILSCTGNVTLKDGKPFGHLHIMLSDTDGKAMGGHLLEGTEVYVAEYIVEEWDGPPLIRELDPETGLYLFPADPRRSL